MSQITMLSLNLTVQQVQLVINGLGELPFKVSEAVIAEIRSQVTPQIKEAAEVKAEPQS